MRSWESVRRLADQWQGVLRSQGPADETVDGAEVDVGLRARWPASAPDTAGAWASSLVARVGQGHGWSGRIARDAPLGGQAMTEFAHAAR